MDYFPPNQPTNDIPDHHSQSSSDAASGDLIPKNEVMSPLGHEHFQHYDVPDFKFPLDSALIPEPVTFVPGYQDGQLGSPVTYTSQFQDAQSPQVTVSGPNFVPVPDFANIQTSTPATVTYNQGHQDPQDSKVPYIQPATQDDQLAPTPVTFLQPLNQENQQAPAAVTFIRPVNQDFQSAPAPEAYVQPVNQGLQSLPAPNGDASNSPSTSTPQLPETKPKYDYMLMPYNHGAPIYRLVHQGPAKEGWEKDPAWEEHNIGGPIWYRGQYYYFVDNNEKK